MCRMIGVIAREPVMIGGFLNALVQQSALGVESPHGDGYGVSVLRDGHWLNIREQSPIWEGATGSLSTLTGTVLILHSRKASPGTAINLTKLHPFCWPGENPGLMFCQNGTIHRPDKLRGNFNSSAIDTEKYFDMVTGNYETSRNLATSLQQAVLEIEQADADPTSLNALLSDGRELIAWKGRILPENTGYHTLFTFETPDLAVVSTQIFDIADMDGTWKPLNGLWSRAFATTAA